MTVHPVQPRAFEVYRALRSRCTPWSALVAAVLLVGLLLRVVDLLGSPYGFFCDEASNGLDAYLIGHTLHDQHGAFLPAYAEALEDWRGAFHIYWEVPFVLLIGLTELAVRLGSAVEGWLTIGLVYVFVGKAYTRTAGIAAAALLAVSPWHLIVSRIGFEFVSLPFVTALCLTCLFIGLEHPRVLPFAFIAASLGIYTYQPGRIFFPLLGLAWCLVYWKPLTRHGTEVFAGLVGAEILQFPTAQTIHSGVFFSRMNQVEAPGLSLRDQITAFLTNYVAHFQPAFLFQSSDDILLLRASVHGFGVLYDVEAPFLLLGLGVMIWQHRRADILFLAWLLLYPVATALVSGPSSFRSIAGVIVFQIVIARGMLACIKGAVWLARQRPHVMQDLRRALTVALVAAVAISTVQFMHAYLIVYPTYASQGWGWQSGPQQIIEYFERHRADYNQELFDADVNAPQVLLRFYATPNPALCAKCFVTDIHNPVLLHAAYQPRLRQLWAIRVDSLDPLIAAHVPYSIVKRLTDPGGNTSWYLVATGPKVAAS